MKKMISLSLSILILSTICLSGCAHGGKTAQTSRIPSPAELQEQYEALAAAQALNDFSSLSAEVSDPILYVGVVAGIAQASDDLSVLAGASEMILADAGLFFQTAP